MKPMAISGIGLISARGRGLASFEAALREGWIPPSASQDGRLAYRVAAEDLTDRKVLERAKRADRFSKLAVLAAHDAVRESGLSLEEVRGTTGVIVATAFGAHSSIFKFLDGIIDYGESKVSPTTFAHSIHNAAAAYVASALETRGPVMTLTHFHFSLQEALLLGYAWLAEKRVDRVLIGTVDECSAAMEYIFEEKFSMASGGQMNPLTFSEKPGLVPGEGSIFFLLSLDPADARHGFFAGLQTGSSCRGWQDADLSILCGNAMSGSEAGYANLLKNPETAVSYTPLYGGLMSSGGFEAAAAVFMLKNQVRYASPVFDKIKGARPCSLRAVQCVSHSSDGAFAFLKLTQSQP